MAMLAGARCGVRNDFCSLKYKYATTSHGMASEILSRGVDLFFAQEFCFFKQKHRPPRGSKQATTDVLLTTVLGPLRRVSLAWRASAPVGPGMLASCVALVSPSGRATRPTQRSLAAREWSDLGSAKGDESVGESESKVMVEAYGPVPQWMPSASVRAKMPENWMVPWPGRWVK